MKKTISRHTARRVKDDPSTDHTLQQLDKRSVRNEEYIKTLRDACEKEMGRSTFVQHTSNKRSRLRQLLILMTGGNADASLFVDGQSGKIVSPEHTYAMVVDLSKPYRLESSPTWAMFRKFGRTAEWVGTRFVGAGYIGAGAFELMALLAFSTGTYYSLANSSSSNVNSTKDTISKNLTERLNTSNGKMASGVAALFLFLRNMNVFENPTDNSLFKGLKNVTTGYNTWRLGNVVEELVSDGVSDSTRARMRRVGNSHVELDLQVQNMSHAELERRVAEFAKANSGLGASFGGLYGSTRNKHKKLAQTFSSYLHTDHSSNSIREFRKDVLSIGVPLKGHHVFNSYGDARSTVQDIIAAYVVQFEREQSAMKNKASTLIPTIAPASSVKAAWKRSRTAKSVVHG